MGFSTSVPSTWCEDTGFLNHQGVFTLPKASCASCSGETVTAELTPRFRHRHRDTTSTATGPTLVPPYLDPNLSVQWSLDGEVTPLWEFGKSHTFFCITSLHCTSLGNWTHWKRQVCVVFFWVVCLLVCAWQQKTSTERRCIYRCLVTLKDWKKHVEQTHIFFGPCLFTSYIFNDWHCGIWDIKWNSGLLKINHQTIGIKKGGLPERAVSSTCKTLHLFFWGG